MAIFCTNCGKEIAEGVAFCTECGTKAPEAVAEPKTEAAAEAVLCKKCGTALPEGVGFCTECGTPRNGEPAAEAPKTAATPPPVRQQTYAPPVQNTVPVAAPDPKTKVVGTGTFFGLQLLFAIPVIGWLACLIMAFAPKNKNIKHYARAMLIWIIIVLVISVVLFFLFKWVGGVIMDYINEVTEGAFGDWGDLFEQFGEMGDIVDQLPEGGFDNLPVE